MRPLRPIAAPFVVASPTGARIRTRLRPSDDDEAVLRAVGAHLGHLAGADLAVRCRSGPGPKHAGRADRKRALTAQSSSRWAGAITRTSADQYERGLKNLVDRRRSLCRAIVTIETRLAAPVGSRRGRAKGYANGAERAQKQRRVQSLRARLAHVEADIGAGRVSVCRGGKRLAALRHHLGDANLDEERWRQRWEAERMFLRADGEADKAWGNETIRVHPDDGWVEVRLPEPLAHLSNTPGRAKTYRLSATAAFAHRHDHWAAQVATGAVAYEISYDPERRRWYLDASWATKPVAPACLDELRSHPTLAVDLNADHLAAWVVDCHGNAVGDPLRIDLDLSGPATTRDGRLRAAISTLINTANAHSCRSISVEDLDFADARAAGRETMGRGRRGKRFRATVAGIATARFRSRLVAMAANRDIAVIAVDPAYTSRWGAQHWLAPLNQQTSSDVTVTRHQAAAVVIGRRSHGHRARRRSEKTRAHQRMGDGEPSTRPDPIFVTAREPGAHTEELRCRSARKTATPEGDPPGDQATQDRSEPPISARDKR